MSGTSDSLSSASKAKTFSSFGSDIDLVSGSDGGGRPCRRIRIQSKGSGVLVVRLAGDSADTTFSNLQDGEVLDVQAVKIKATGTSVSAINVFW
jgi:hypothetical protein